jgi:tetratricopeptide (TPR) repeat protein
MKPYVLLLAAILYAQVSPAQETYEAIMQRADTEFSQQEYADALKDCLAAAALNPNNYLAHYYMGLIYLRLDKGGEAVREANTALGQAPDAANQNIQTLLNKATALVKASQLKAQANTDLANGLRSKAALEFDASYIAYHIESSAGFQAVSLYDSLGDLPHEMQLLRTMETDDDAAVSDKAKNLMSSQMIQVARDLYGNLTHTAETMIDGDLIFKASREALAQAEENYQQAVMLFPICSKSGLCPWWKLARVQCMEGKKEAVYSTLRAASGMGLSIDITAFQYYRYDDLSQLPLAATMEEAAARQKAATHLIFDGVWNTYVCDSTFIHFLGDAYGSNASVAATSMCSAITPKPPR